MGSCQTIGFASMIEDATSWEEWREGFSLVTEGETNQMNWKTFCWQPIILLIFYHNQNQHKKIIPFYSCHILKFMNMHVSKLLGDY
jgi:hypothetical protein